MFSDLYQSIVQFLQGWGFLPSLGVVYILSLILFWYESKHVHKDSNSVFDQWFLATFIMMIWGRVAYVINNWAEFSNWYWFYIPYEKYGDQIYLFRAMPWKLFQFWDGGFLFIPMFLCYLVVSYLFVVYFKRWRWREMMIAVLGSANFMLALTLILYGIFINNESIRSYGVYILILVCGYLVIVGILKFLYRAKKEVFVKVGQLVIVLFTLGDIWLISYIFLSRGITDIDTYHVYGFVVFASFMLMAYIYDVRSKLDVSTPVQSLDQKERGYSIFLRQAGKRSSNEN